MRGESMIGKEDKREWEQVYAMTRWTPTKKGDEITGVYVKRRENVGARDYTFYILRLETGETRDVLGTTLLDVMMDQISIGWEVRIVYQGENKPIPPHQGLKLFDVYKRPADLDTTTGAAGEDEPEQSGAGLVDKDDPEAKNMIEHYENMLRNQNRVVTPEAVIQIAESDPDREATDLSRLKVQLARNLKAGVE